MSQNSIFSKKFQKIFKNIFKTYIQLLPTIGGPHFCNNIFFKIFYSPRRGRFVQNLKFLSYLTFLGPSETTFPKFSKLPQLKLPHTYPIFNILKRIKSKLDRKLWNFWFSGGRYYRFLRTKKFSWCICRFYALPKISSGRLGNLYISIYPTPALYLICSKGHRRNFIGRCKILDSRRVDVKI